MKSSHCLLCAAAFAALGFAKTSFAVDGTCTPNSYYDYKRCWSWATYWQDGQIARDGGVATLRNLSNSGEVSGKLSNDVVNLTLSGLVIDGTIWLYGRPITMTGDAFLQMENNSTLSLGLTLDGAGTATLTKRGGGTVKFVDADKIQNFKSVVVNSSGAVAEGAQCGQVAITDGDVEFKSADFIYAPTTATSTEANRLAGDHSLTFSGESVIDLCRVSGNTNALRLPNALVRTNSGVLAVYPREGVSALGGSNQLYAPSVANDSIGMVSPWLYAHDSVNSKAIHFLSNSADKGLLPMPSSAKTATLADADGKIWTPNADVTVSEDASVHAIDVLAGAAITIASGKKLTVGEGDAPAGVIVDYTGNAKKFTDYTYPVISGGTLDFGEREGIFLSAESGENDMVTISSAIVGSNVTFAAGANGTGRRWQLKGANKFSGTLTVLGSRVEIPNQAAIGAADVRVAGNTDSTLGGQISVSVGTYTNRFFLSGSARDNNMRATAVLAGGTVNFKGPVTLEADATVAASSAAYTINFDNEIDGPGGLATAKSVSSWPGNAGVVALNRANSYLGETVVNTGTVKLGKDGTFGAGKVSGAGKLAFELNGAAKTIPNAIDLAGAASALGAGVISFTGASVDFAAFDAGSASVVAGGEHLGLGAFSADVHPASVTAAEGEHEVSMGGDADVSPDVVLADGAGKLSFTKTGEGTLTFVRSQAYSGTTSVKRGTLAFGKVEPSSAGILYHLDASKTDTLLFNADKTSVTGWTDTVSGTLFGVKFAAHSAPVYDATAFGDRGAVRFPDNNLTNRLSSFGGSVKHRTVVIVCQPDRYVNLDGVWGAGGGSAAGSDYGLRMGGKTTWQAGIPSFFFARTADDMRINGVTGNTFTDVTAPQILFARHVDGTPANYDDGRIGFTPSIGSYFYDGKNAPRTFRGAIAEVIAYDRLLSEEEIKLVENSLSQKWLGTTIHEDVEVGGELSSSSSLALCEGATLDLCGTSQTVASLSGVGAIVNSSDSPATLTVSGANTFVGTVGANVSLVANGGGSTKLAADAGAAITLGGASSLAAYDPFPIASGRVLWLDASRPDTITTNALGHVVDWRDAGGGKIHLEPCWSTNDFGDAATALWEYDAATGRGAAKFSHSTTNYLYASEKASVQSLFFVCKVSGDDYKQNDGMWGYNGTDDFGLRRHSTTTWQLSGNGTFFHAADFRVDGAPATSYATDKQQLHVIRKFTPSASGRQILGGYYKYNATFRPFGGEVMEFVAYSRALTDDETLAVEAYLSAKWNAAKIEHRTQPLADGATLALKSDADVDLGGASLALGSIAGGGKFKNGAVTLGGVLTVNVDAQGKSTPLTVENGSVAIDGATLNCVGALSRKFFYPVVVCPQILGAFAGDNLPDGWELGARANGLCAKPIFGTVLIVR